MADSRRSVTDNELLQTLRSGARPVWTSTFVAEEHDITRQTANKRLKKLEREYDELESIDIGRATAYYIPDTDDLPPAKTTKERHKRSIIQYYEDRFVGLPTEPWTAVHPNDGPATGGDKVQLEVHGRSRDWEHDIIRLWENRRTNGLEPDEIIKTETQALISGTLYEKPTVPIAHREIPEDYDLEGNTGAQYREFEGHSRPVLIATGLKNYLLKPCNEAVFLTNVSVDWISPKGQSSNLPVSADEPTEIPDHIDLDDEIDEIDATDNPL